jgi:hypothetical protein
MMDEVGDTLVSGNASLCTVIVLLALVTRLYNAVDACVAVNVTYPAATSVIIPLLLIVAIFASLGEYVIPPLLALVGIVKAENGAEPYVRFELTVNADRIGVPLLIVTITVPLPLVKFVVAVWDMVIIAEPTPAIPTYDVSKIVTMLALPLENEMKPPPRPSPLAPFTSVFVDEG